LSRFKSGKTATTMQHSPSIEQFQAQDEDQDPVALFVGKKIDYYRNKWALAATRKNKASWNMAAFLFGPAWFLYRKMFWQSGLILAVVMVEAIAETVLFPDMLASTSNFLSFVITITVGIVSGTFGNAWYKAHVDKAVARLQASSAPAESYRKQGGTSWLPILGTAGFIAVVLAVAFALQPNN
jgi:hypothetical protein